MKNLITIKQGSAIVTMDTIEKFSGHKTKSLRDVIHANESDILDMSLAESPKKASGENSPQQTLRLPAHSSGANKGKVDWSRVEFDEKQSMYLLTLLGNTEQVKIFKKNLVTQFFKMRDEVMFIREQAIREEAQKQIAKVIEDSKKLNDYDGFVTITKFIQEFNTEEYDKDLIYDALTWKGLNKDEIVQTIYRRLPEDVADYLGRTISGAKGTPIYPPAIIQGVIKEYLELVGPEEE